MVSIVHNFTKNNFSLQRTKYSGSWSTERASKLLLGCICSYSIQACCLTKILFKKRKLKTQTSFVFLKKKLVKFIPISPPLKVLKIEQISKNFAMLFVQLQRMSLFFVVRYIKNVQKTWTSGYLDIFSEKLSIFLDMVNHNQITILTRTKFLDHQIVNAIYSIFYKVFLNEKCLGKLKNEFL